ncbi:hypothetical protein EV356DRAFT_519032 [Viridothelium virens]|uniref:Uncharacterized protein n=1 Tax=Viridothelium virens TaxID=1048519 RepID=A0A6A6GZK2_VIRVR|nr:hypothetical protein EV356DRAFT_519032 [Viridothelium virens]
MPSSTVQTVLSLIWGKDSYILWLKIVLEEAIPEPHPEPALPDAMPQAAFACYMDDDVGGAESFDDLFDFLHNHYFPRIASDLWTQVLFNGLICVVQRNSSDLLQRARLSDARFPVDTQHDDNPMPQTQERDRTTGLRFRVGSFRLVPASACPHRVPRLSTRHFFNVEVELGPLLEF